MTQEKMRPALCKREGWAFLNGSWKLRWQFRRV
jgi:hypothetical protein